jgi:hypothetical protein
MKRFVFIFSIACLFFLSFTACGNGTSVKTQTSIDAVAKYLSSATGGATVDNPVPLIVKIDLQNMLATDSGWKKLLGAINTAGKYVALDLSACTMPGTEFNPDSGFEDGKKFIVSLILPDTTESLVEVRDFIAVFQHFMNLNDVPIGKKIVTVGDMLFYMMQLDSITIPDGFTSIGNAAFFRCGLTSVTIPNSVTTIGDNAFAGNQLTSLTIPNSVTTIGWRAFMANQLTSVTIPGSVLSIEKEAFANNPLSSVTISNGVAVIGDSVFTGSYNNRGNLTSVTIPESVTTIGDNAFSYNQLTSVTIPNGVTTIGESAFAYNRLADVTIPNSVITIGAEAFNQNQLSSVTIPNSVMSLYGNEFNYNPLISITIGANVSIFTDFWGQSGSSGYNFGFWQSYNNNGKQAGTYTRPAANLNNRTWIRR